MQAFTPVTSWTYGGQDNEAANEIVTAYFEHRKILGQAPSGYALIAKGINAQRIWYDPAIGGDGQGKNVFQEMHEWLETYCTSFLDTTTTDSFLNTGKTGFVNYTKATWQAAAGLNVSDVANESFRRKVNMMDGWSYGEFQIGDIRGPWCFEDLQNGFNALKWTLTGGTYVYPSESRKTLNYYDFLYQELEPGHPDWPTLAQVRAQFIAVFEAQAWTGSSGDGGYKINAYDGPRSWGWNFAATRVRSQQTLTLPLVTRKVDAYILTTGDGDFVDFDSVGFVEGKYTKYGDLGETSDAVVVLDYVGNVNVCPIGISTHGSIRAADYSEPGVPNFMKYVLKWQFTYGKE